MSQHPIPLLPCPWCGSEAIETYMSDDWTSVRCKKCRARGPANSNGCDEATAIAAWNKGPYADRHEIHAAALRAHAKDLEEKAAKHAAKAKELLEKAAAAKGVK